MTKCVLHITVDDPYEYIYDINIVNLKHAKKLKQFVDNNPNKTFIFWAKTYWSIPIDFNLVHIKIFEDNNYINVVEDLLKICPLKSFEIYNELKKCMNGNY